jgi:hypothetical protein
VIVRFGGHLITVGEVRIHPHAAAQPRGGSVTGWP